MRPLARVIVGASLTLAASADTRASPGQTSPAPAAAPASQEPADRGPRWEFRDHPRLVIGGDTWVDFRLKLQADYRDVDAESSEALERLAMPVRRIGIEGQVTRFLEYEISRELDDSTDPWRAVYANFHPHDAAQLQGGHFKVPFSRERLTGPMHLDFTERPLGVTLLAPGYDTGAMAHGFLPKHVLGYAVGVFRGTPDGVDPDNVEPPVAGLLPAAKYDEPLRAWRVTSRPLARVDAAPGWLRPIEVGVNGVESRIDEGRFGWRGETLYGREFFDRVHVNGRRTRLGIEGALVTGPWSVVAEWLRGLDERLGQGVADDDLPALEASAWYVSGVVVLTGEPRRTVDRPKRPLFRGGVGSAEVAVRLEEIAFGSRDTRGEPPSFNPRGAHLMPNADRLLTLGVNYYPNRFLRVQMNAMRERLDAGFGETPGPAGPFWSTVVRVQVGM